MQSLQLDLNSGSGSTITNPSPKKKELNKTSPLLVNKVIEANPQEIISSSVEQSVTLKKVKAKKADKKEGLKEKNEQEELKEKDKKEDSNYKKLFRRPSFTITNSNSTEKTNYHSIGGSIVNPRDNRSSLIIDPSPRKEKSPLQHSHSLYPSQSSHSSFLNPSPNSSILKRSPSSHSSFIDQSPQKVKASHSMPKPTIEKVENMSKQLATFANKFQEKVEFVSQAEKLSNPTDWEQNKSVVMQVLMQQLKEEMGGEWTSEIRPLLNAILSSQENEEETRVLSKIDLQSLGFLSSSISGTKEHLGSVSPSPKKSPKLEKHLEIAHNCLNAFIPESTSEGVFIFENKTNVKKLTKLYPSHTEFKEDPITLLSHYIEDLMQFGELLKTEKSKLLLKNNKYEHPFADRAKDFAKDIHALVGKQFKKIKEQLQIQITDQCCVDFGDCIIKYAQTLKIMQTRQISDAARNLMQFIDTTSDTTKFFEQEGTFRVSGNKSTVDDLVNGLLRSSEFKVNSIFDSNKLKYATPELASALKELFGKMRLFATPELEKVFFHTAEDILTEIEESKIIEKLKGLIKHLHPDQIQDLKSMMQIMDRVAQNSQINKMTHGNLAIVFGQRLCSPKNQKTASKNMEHINTLEDQKIALKNMELINTLAIKLITYHDKVFL